MKLEFYRQNFEKYTNIKFHENQYSGKRVFLCVPTERQTDMTSLVVAFGNFANAPKNVRMTNGLTWYRNKAYQQPQGHICNWVSLHFCKTLMLRTSTSTAPFPIFRHALLRFNFFYKIYEVTNSTKFQAHLMLDSALASDRRSLSLV